MSDGLFQKFPLQSQVQVLSALESLAEVHGGLSPLINHGNRDLRTI